MAKPPDPGSVMEILCLMVQMRREMKELYKTHAVVQAVMLTQHPDSKDDGEAVRKAFASYKDHLMPYLKSELKKEESKIVKAMWDEANRGPMKVTPIQPMRVSSRLRQLNKSQPTRRKAVSQW